MSGFLRLNCDSDSDTNSKKHMECERIGIECLVKQILCSLSKSYSEESEDNSTATQPKHNPSNEEEDT